MGNEESGRESARKEKVVKEDCEQCRSEQARAAEMSDQRGQQRPPGNGVNVVDPGRGENVEAQLDACLGRSLEQLSNAFTVSARRWELIVYPALLMFCVLAAYGFYLIYSLTKDVGILAEQITIINNSMRQISANVDRMSGNVEQMSGNISSMTDHVTLMTGDISEATEVMSRMVIHMRDMNVSMQSMNVAMEQMRYHIGVMNQSVSRPMSFMNSFLPW